jgi:hypothetical protein
MLTMLVVPLADNAAGVPSGWTATYISPGSFEYTSMAIDTNGKVHIVYIDGNDPISVKYVNDVSGSWSTPYIIDTASIVAPKLALDSQGYCHVTYVNGNNLIYATNSGGSWYNATIYTSSNGYEKQVSLVVDHNNHVDIAFVPHNSGTIRLANNSAGSWTNGTVTFGATASTNYPALAIDSSNNLHMACEAYGTMSGVLYLSQSSGNWTAEIADSYFGISGIVMCLDHNNKAHIATIHGQVAVGYISNEGGSWASRLVTAELYIGAIATVPGIVVDSSNNPIISYNGPTAMTYYVNVTSRSGSTWTTTQLATGVTPSIAINSGNQLYVAWQGTVGSTTDTYGAIIASTGTVTPSSGGTTAPGPVASATATAGTNGITVTWTSPSSGGSATSVLIYRSTTNSMPSTALTTVGASALTYLDGTAVNGTSYYYWVVSSNSAGKGSATATGSITAGSSSSSSSSSSPSSNSGGLVLIVIVVVVVLALVVIYFRFLKKK